MVMPKQKPGKSEQVVETDPRLIKAVVRRFGPLVVDLAASASNTQAPCYITKEENALTQNWSHGPKGNRWLNPPFRMIAKFAKKCCTDATRGCPIFLHVPASPGANWFRDYVWNKSYVLFLNGRVTYVGHKHGYPKDCMVACYGLEKTLNAYEWTMQPKIGSEIWEWMKDVAE